MSEKRRVKTCKSSLYFLLEGNAVEGFGVGARYVRHPLYKRFFESLLGCTPYPGTLNVRVSSGMLEKAWVRLLNAKPPCLIYAPRDPQLSPLWVLEALVYGIVPALLIRPLATSHPENIVEIVSCIKLREVVEALGEVYVVTGCGLLRCFEEWKSVILRATSSSL